MIFLTAKPQQRLLLYIHPERLCFLGAREDGELVASLSIRAQLSTLSEEDLLPSVEFIYQFFNHQKPCVELIFPSDYLELNADENMFENLALASLPHQRTWINKDVALQIVRTLNSRGISVAKISCVHDGVQKFAEQHLQDIEISAILHLGAELTDLFVMKKGRIIEHQVIDLGCNIILSDVMASSKALQGASSRDFPRRLREIIFSRYQNPEIAAREHSTVFLQTANGLSVSEIVSARIRELCFFTGQCLLPYKGKLSGSFYISGEGCLIPEVPTLFKENLRIDVQSLAPLLSRAINKPVRLAAPTEFAVELQPVFAGPIDSLSLLLMSSL